MRTLTILIAIVLFASCEKDETKPKNELIGTSWTAPNPIAEMIYGGTCTTTIEFLNDSECQIIEKKVNTWLSEGTEVFPGTYEIYSNNDSVKWEADDKVTKGRISGSIIITNHLDLNGNPIIFTKD